MKSNITLEVFESIVIEQLKERGYNTGGWNVPDVVIDSQRRGS